MRRFFRCSSTRYKLGRTNGGGRSKSFRWWWDGRTLHIKRENGLHDRFRKDELLKILQSLKDQFDSRWFPLANNVDKMSKGIETPGLGMTILGIRPGDITHAQASSYLGVVFEYVGLATWNEKHRGIEWCLNLNRTTPTDEELTELFGAGFV